MTTAAQRAVNDARAALAKAEAVLREERARRRILCSCGQRHAIKDLDVLQTHWYEGPHGCTGGDAWHPGELQFICPSDGTRNRLMFNDSYLDWREQGSIARHFSGMYKRLFKSVTDTYDRTSSCFSWEKAPRFNNHYVDEHRERFELPAKPKETR